MSGKDIETYFHLYPHKDVDDQNLMEARGAIIARLCVVEGMIDRIIESHFKPQNQIHFRTILLNSSTISFGGKVKVLRGLEIIDKDTYENLMRLGQIRNAFAHAEIFLSIEQDIPQDGKKSDFRIHHTLTTMSSNGTIKESNAKILAKEFDKKCRDVWESLRPILESIKE